MRWFVRAAFVAMALAFVGSALAGDTKPIQGKVVGNFASASSCFGCGEMIKYVKADRAWVRGRART